MSAIVPAKGRTHSASGIAGLLLIILVLPIPLSILFLLDRDGQCIGNGWFLECNYRILKMAPGWLAIAAIVIFLSGLGLIRKGWRKGSLNDWGPPNVMR